MYCTFYTASDNLLQSLKTSLKTEQQKNTLLHEDLKVKKEAVQRLRKGMQTLRSEMDIHQQKDQSKVSQVKNPLTPPSTNKQTNKTNLDHQEPSKGGGGVAHKLKNIFGQAK